MLHAVVYLIVSTVLTHIFQEKLHRVTPALDMSIKILALHVEAYRLNIYEMLMISFAFFSMVPLTFKEFRSFSKHFYHDSNDIILSIQEIGKLSTFRTKTLGTFLITFKILKSANACQI